MTAASNQTGFADGRQDGDAASKEVEPGSRSSSMSAPRLTKRLLNAMSTAISSMLAGMEGEGDWPDDLPRRDLEDAEYWISHQLMRKAMTDDAEASAPLIREQFWDRFIAHFVWRLGPEMRGCADEVWESYWENPDQRADGPEVCAAAELDEWYD